MPDHSPCSRSDWSRWNFGIKPQYTSGFREKKVFRLFPPEILFHSKTSPHTPPKPAMNSYSSHAILSHPCKNPEFSRSFFGRFLDALFFVC
jgi:hypothetical protein